MMGLHNSFSCSSFIKPTSGTSIASHLEDYRDFHEALKEIPAATEMGMPLDHFPVNYSCITKYPRTWGFKTMTFS